MQLRLLRTDFLGALSDEEQDAADTERLRSSLLADPAITKLRIKSTTRNRLLKDK